MYVANISDSDMFVTRGQQLFIILYSLLEISTENLQFLNFRIFISVNFHVISKILL